MKDIEGDMSIGRRYEIESSKHFYKSVKTMRIFTFAGDFCLCNGSTYVWSWILQTSNDDLGSGIFGGSQMEECMIHEPTKCRSGYSIM